MRKHLLLPERYSDASMQSAILFALGPYTLTDKGDIANPQMKWNLNKAWQDAQNHLRKTHWVHDGDEDTPVQEISTYELAADTEEEIEALNSILAGIVACQILDPESGLFIRRVDYRKGGEMALLISPSVADTLRERFPKATFGGKENE